MCGASARSHGTTVPVLPAMADLALITLLAVTLAAVAALGWIGAEVRASQTMQELQALLDRLHRGPHG